MKKLLLSFALAACALGAEAQTPLVSIDMTGSNWISADVFNTYTADTKVVFTFNAEGFTEDVANWGIGEIADADGKVKFKEPFVVTKEGENTAATTVAALMSIINDESVTNEWGLCWNVWNAGSCKISRTKMELFAASPDAVIKEVAMNGSGWISKSVFNDLSDDTRAVFTFNATGFAEEVKNWTVGEIAGADQENKKAFCVVTKEGENTAELTAKDLKDALKGAKNQDGICWNMWAAENNTTKCTTATVKIEFFLASSASALRPVKTDADVVSTDYYTLSGSKFSTPQKGINIVRRTLSDGTVQTDKVVIK